MSEIESARVAVVDTLRQRRLHRYALACDLIAGLKVLVIGLGDGQGPALLSRRAGGLDGIDPSPVRAAAAQRLGLARAAFQAALPDALPFEDGCFDAVLVFDLDWTAETAAVLDEIRRVLKPSGFAMLRIDRAEAEALGVHVRRAFKHRFALGQRIVAVSAIGPASPTVKPNTADYRGYTLAADGAAVPGVVRMGPFEDVIWVVSDTALPRTEAADSLFLEASDDLWAAGMSDPPADATPNEKPRKTPAAAPAGGEMAVLTALVEEISGGPVVADAASLARALGQANVRLAVQDLKLAEVDRLNAGLAAAEQEHRRLTDQIRESRDETAATRLLATEQRARADQLQERLAAAMHEAEARRQIIDESLGETQTLAVALEQARQHVEATQAHLQDMVQASAAASQRKDEEIRGLQDAVQRLNQEGEALKAVFNGQLELERQAAAEAAARASSEISALNDRVLEADSVREALAAELERLQVENDAARQASRPVTHRSMASGPDLGFAIGLRERIQSAAVAEVQAYRSGFAAATTVRAVQRDIAGRLSRADGAAASVPVAKLKLDPGPRQPIGRQARLRDVLKGKVRPEAPSASAEALAALFDARYYIDRNGIAPAPGETPFDHYVRKGRGKGLSTHPLIDVDWIRGVWPDGAETPFDLFAYINDVRLHDLAPHPLFEADHYRRMQRDVAEAGVNPLAHYLTHGWREGRNPNQMFDDDWYLVAHADVLAAGATPLLHYAMHGAQELRQPHPLFDHAFYLDRYPDVTASGMDAYAHFIAYGRAEGRLPSRQVLDLQRLERFFDGATINDLLLLTDQPESRLKPIEDDFWPPRPAQDYWLPQKLRDYITDRYGEDRLQLNAWLFSLVEHYAEAPEAFDNSAECGKLIERAALLAGAPLNGRPKASIIIPVYNNLLYTLTCLVSVLESAPNHSFEILIGDDGSSDGTAEAMARIGGLVRHVRHPKNLGFLGNCNAVARRATGEHLVLLNNDTIVFPGWLDSLIETLDGDPRVGFVGSKLLNGDGSLQEAGGIFWRDGSAWNYGRDGDALAPEFNYLKDVDYVSGASIAVPARLWKALDGFDPVYSPAYCEDSDLAFRVREAGYRTVYDPHSVLVHHEGRSHGRDVASGVKAYQLVNQRKLLERWGPTLSEQNFNNGENVFLARDRSRERPHVLVVDHYAPQWDQDAGSRTMFHFIRAFVNCGFQVTFWPDNLNEDRAYVAPLQRMGVEVIYGPRFVGGFDAWLAENGRHIDYALLSRPHISENYIDAITRSGIKTLYYGHDLHCLRGRSTYQITGDRNDLIEAEQWEVRELSVSLKSDVVMYPGIEEIDYMSRLLPASARLIRPPITIFDAAELDAAERAIDEAETVDPYALMFVGGFSHTPNGDGISWFLDRIWPRLRAADERFSLRIAGSRMPDSLRERGDPGVEYLGRVSDEELAGIYAASGAAIVPLRYGGGIKGKVIEAFARGVPVVMTDIGAQGIPGAHDLAFVAGADGGFADAVLAAVADRAEALSRARRAVDFLRAQYSEQAFCDRLAAEVPELAGGGS